MSRSKKSESNSEQVDFLMNEDFLSPRSTGFKSSSSQWMMQSPFSQIAGQVSSPTNMTLEIGFHDNECSPDTSMQQMASNINAAVISIDAPRTPPSSNSNYEAPFSPSMFSPQLRKSNKQNRRNNPTEFDNIKFPDMKEFPGDSANNANTATANGTKTKPPKPSKKRSNAGIDLMGSYTELGYNNMDCLQKSASIADNEPTSEDYYQLLSPSVDNIRSALIKSCHNTSQSNLMKHVSPEVPVNPSNSNVKWVSHGGSNANLNNADDDRVKCNCKKSKCLKLYCQCFAVVQYCDPAVCKCVECNNCIAFEEVRQDAIKQTKERNRQAFVVKVSDEQSHTSGCTCKKSRCLKKYCECYEAFAYCGDNCKCISCQNFAGSVELESTNMSRDLKKQAQAQGLNNSGISMGYKMPYKNVIQISNSNAAYDQDRQLSSIEVNSGCNGQSHMQTVNSGYCSGSQSIPSLVNSSTNSSSSGNVAASVPVHGNAHINMSQVAPGSNGSAGVPSYSGYKRKNMHIQGESVVVQHVPVWSMEMVHPSDAFQTHLQAETQSTEDDPNSITVLDACVPGDIDDAHNTTTGTVAMDEAVNMSTDSESVVVAYGQKTPPQIHSYDVSSADTIVHSMNKSDVHEISILSPIAIECGIESKKHADANFSNVLFSTNQPRGTKDVALSAKATASLLNSHPTVVVHNVHPVVTDTATKGMQLEVNNQSSISISDVKTAGATKTLTSPQKTKIVLSNQITNPLSKSKSKPTWVPRIRLKSKSVIMYPFFPGEIINGIVKTNVRLPKVLALCILDFLGDADIYHMALVNKLWYSVAYDESMWE